MAKKTMSCADAGALGGRRTAETRGSAWFALIGRKAARSRKRLAAERAAHVAALEAEVARLRAEHEEA